MKKLFKRNEKGAGGIAETLIIVLFAVLITGAVALMIYNAIQDKGNTVTQGIRSSGGTPPSDIDGDGKLNGVTLVAKANDGTKYYKRSNPITDFGQPGVTAAQLDDDDDGDTTLINHQEMVAVNATVTPDKYFAKLGASFKANQPSVGGPVGGLNLDASYVPQATVLIMSYDPQTPN